MLLECCPPLLDFEMTTRPNLRFSQIQPLQIRFDSFSTILPTIYIYICVLEQKRKRRRRRKKVDEKHRDKRKIEEDVTRRLWCSLESTYNVGRWPAFFLYIYIYIKEDRLPETEDQVVLVQSGWTRRGCRKEIFSSHLLLASWEIGLLLVLKI